ncbi:Nucleoside diphosphate kinase-like protein 5 [Cryptotermes secundus]|uniref:Nucleoside diphosphate kinase homolog 5 n=2 Tax=Cryptotermes secundus TaxID=105785 RepID=A0A2J7RGB8_9NEOP|nr:Nucleoside diphosphate kinase-like protein 5 [Cryptotermes secundus]
MDAEILSESNASVQRTLAIIKPEALPYADEIEEKIKEDGYTIAQKRVVTLTGEQVTQFYSEQYDSPGFPKLMAHMSSGPIIVLCLSKNNAVDDWNTLIGPANVSEARHLFPACLRAKYGDQSEDTFNGLHGSENEETAEKEIRFFFPEMILEPLLTGEAVTDYLAESVNPTLLEGLAQLCKVKPADPVVWLADWLLMNNPNKPRTDEIITPIPT